MSFWRAKLRATDRNNYLDNQLTNFTNPPIYYGDLHVKNNQTIGGNLDICGNLHIGKDLTAHNYYATGNYYLNNYILVPYGTIIQFAGQSAPGGWVFCDGTSYNKVLYANLFGAIGNLYGGLAGDLSFNVPDFRGRVGVGAGDGPGPSLSNRILSQTGGEETHTLTVPEMPSHTHTHNAPGGDYNNGLVTLDGTGTPGSIDNGGHELKVANSPIALVINSTGGGGAHNNMQPFIVVNYLIKY